MQVVLECGVEAGIGLAGIGRPGGVLAQYVELLRSPAADLVVLCLQFLELVLRNVSGAPQIIEALDGIERLESLQYNDSEELRGKLLLLPPKLPGPPAVALQ